MHFKRKIREKVYNLYLSGVGLQFIGLEYNLTLDEVDEIIDYMNEIHNAIVFM